MTIIAGDATPTDPISFGPCVDINSGQRCNTALLPKKLHVLHVLLKAADAALTEFSDQSPSSKTSVQRSKVRN